MFNFAPSQPGPGRAGAGPSPRAETRAGTRASPRAGIKLMTRPKTENRTGLLLYA